jgi:Antibiotic biosynthesis monooxygenase
MTAFNVVRVQVKPGKDKEFLDAHKRADPNWAGLRHVNIVQTGDSKYCVIAEWDNMDALVNARPQMIAILDSFRHVLVDLGGGLGVTDPASGSVVLKVK